MIPRPHWSMSWKCPYSIMIIVKVSCCLADGNNYESPYFYISILLSLLLFAHCILCKRSVAHGMVS